MRFESAAYPHRFVVDLDAVERLLGLGCLGRFVEDHCGLAAAASVRSIRQKHLLDRANSLGEEILITDAC